MEKTSLLKNFFNVLTSHVRHKNRHIEVEGIRYPGFTYYPRHPDFKDPPYEATKLFLIKRIAPMKGLNPVERKILERLNIDGQNCFNKHISIVKNIPEVNASLWKVKHLVQIKPIRFVNGLPADGDCSGTFLRDDGTFMVSDKYKVEKERIEATEKFIADKKRFNRKYWLTYLMKRWRNPLSSDV